jgi:hypothetical protein
MAGKEGNKEPKRLNRTVGLGEVVGGVLGPALRKRGFAGRDIIAQWGAIAPKPYDVVSVPDRLAWPRGGRSAEGATLYLRCTEGHALMLQHEGPRLAAAVNRYFGYLLVKDVRLSAEPLRAAGAELAPAPIDPVSKAKVSAAVRGVADDGLKDALRKLGEGIARRR